MSDFQDYQYVKHDDNFLTGDTDYDENDPNAPPRGDIVTEVNGVYTFSYHFLTAKNELSAANGYDVVTQGEDANDTSTHNIEYGLFVEGSHSAIESAVSYIMGNNTDLFSVFFTDVVDNIAFTETSDANAAQINIGKIAYPNNAPAYAKDFYNPSEGQAGVPGEANYSQAYDENIRAHGDIWINTNLDGNSGAYTWDNMDTGSSQFSGSPQFSTLIHELGHVLGLEHTADSNGNPDPIDNQKYSIMSYHTLESMGQDGTFDALYVTGLQLYDIAALQEIYGSRNYATRGVDDPDTTDIDEANTIYDKDGAFASSAAHGAFIYTIWDGAGNDKIDASGYTQSAKIDLRQGAFSSVGADVSNNALFDWSLTSSNGINITRDIGNLAVAYYTVIEEAIGTSNNDVLIGNA